METLRQKYIPIAKEYARQFGEVIGSDFAYWVGEPGHCAVFDNDQTYVMEDIMYVIDYLDEFTEKYGSRQAVGETVSEWFDYTTDDGTPERMRNFNLQSWLRGISDPAIREEILRDGKGNASATRHDDIITD